MAVNPSGEGSYFSYPFFVKVITLPPDQGLKLPYAFMRKYGHDLQDVVFLKVPTGSSWQVELVHYEDYGTLLQKGWEEFSEYFSIKKFYFLTFKYEGNAQFHVSIFDQTALEIEYPGQTYRERIRSGIPTSDRRGRPHARTVPEISNDDEEFEVISATILEENDLTTRASKRKRALEEEDVSIEILDDPSESKPKSRSSHKLTLTEKQRESRNYRGNVKSKRNQNGNSGKGSKGTKKPLKRLTITNKEKSKSYQRAKAFTSPNPFFISFMQPTYVSGKFTLEIQTEFWKAYMQHKKTPSSKTSSIGKEDHELACDSVF